MYGVGETVRSDLARILERNQDVSNEEAGGIQGLVNCVQAMVNELVRRVEYPGLVAGRCWKKPVYRPVFIGEPLCELLPFLNRPLKAMVEHIVPITE